MTAAELKRQVPTPDIVATDLYSIEWRNAQAQCPFPEQHSHGDRDHSLRYDAKRERIFCASQQCFGEKGSDVIGLVKVMDGCEFPAAMKKLASHYGVRNGTGPRQSTPNNGTKPKRPTPADKVRRALEREGFRVVAEHYYADNLRKVRFEHTTEVQEEKQRPEKTCRWEHSRDGRWYTGRGGRETPIYTNQVFRERDLVEFALGVEGEPHADLAGEMGHPAFSFKELKDATNCEDLRDLDIVLWPDNDAEGRKMAAEVAARLTTIARSVRAIQIPDDFPPAGDIVDAVRDLEWNRQRVERLIDDAQPVAQKTSTALVLSKSQLPIAVGSPDAQFVPVPDLMQKLVLTQNRRPRAVLANAITVFRHEQSWEGALAFNEFTLGVEVMKPLPWESAAKIPYVWTDQEDRLATEWLQLHGIHVSPDTVSQAAQTVAMANPFHPVRDYLEGLAWDGKERLDGWLSTYCGAAPSPVISAFGAKWLISAVARILQPGVKADCCLILEGPQGLGKSTTFRILGGDWFTDELAEIGNKDSSLQAGGVWIIEIAELASFNRSEVSKIKSFISRSTDRFRPPYGRRVAEFPRQCVFGGTVNHDNYLRDETGARRFWPVTCGGMDLKGLERDRDQLWAEAVRRYRAGERWWLDSEYLNRAASDEQSARYEGDAWDNLIMEWVADLDNVSIDEVLELCIGKDKSQWGPGDRTRIGRCLSSLGWERYQVREGGKRPRRYRRTEGVTSVSPE